MAEEKNLFIAVCIFILKLIFVILLSFVVFWVSVKSYDLLYDWVLTNHEKSIEESLEMEILQERTIKDDEVQLVEETKANYFDRIVAMSNIRRNYFLLFFAIFAGVIAIWARLNHGKQLEHTEKQIEHTEKQINNTEKQLAQTREQLEYTQQQIKNSLAANRNDHYAGAVEMLEKDKSEVSYRGGLYMLGELMIGGSEAECILYGETITDWLKSADISSGLKTVAIKLLVE